MCHVSLSFLSNWQFKVPFFQEPDRGVHLEIAAQSSTAQAERQTSACIDWGFRNALPSAHWLRNITALTKQHSGTVLSISSAWFPFFIQAASQLVLSSPILQMRARSPGLPDSRACVHGNARRLAGKMFYPPIVGDTFLFGSEPRLTSSLHEGVTTWLIKFAHCFIKHFFFFKAGLGRNCNKCNQALLGEDLVSTHAYVLGKWGIITFSSY